MRRYARLALWVVMAAFAVGLAAREKEPAVSMTPLNAEQLAVYRVVIARTWEPEMRQVNLAVKTVRLNANEPENNAGCGKKLDLEPESALVHRFQTVDLAQLGSDKIKLVEPERGRKDVEENDPEHAIRNPSAIEGALRNAYAHGLYTLSEIQFDKKHDHAILSYGFVCGRLCGHGETLILEKSEEGWRVSGQCGNWISQVPSGETAPRCG